MKRCKRKGGKQIELRKEQKAQKTVERRRKRKTLRKRRGKEYKKREMGEKEVQDYSAAHPPNLLWRKLSE